MRIPHGDLNLAKQILDQVAISNAEDVGRAKELVKMVDKMIHNRLAAVQQESLYASSRDDPKEGVNVAPRPSWVTRMQLWCVLEIPGFYTTQTLKYRTPTKDLFNLNVRRITNELRRVL